MDPDEALKRAREAVDRINKIRDSMRDDDEEESADELDEPVEEGELESLAFELADHFEALDGWLKKGGFLPRVWRYGDL